jgi:hypothetical protein
MAKSLYIPFFVVSGGWFLWHVFRGYRGRRCAKCDNPVGGPGTYCPSCTATVQEEARQAHEKWQAEERAKADEQRSQRDRAEEEARRRLHTLEDLHRLTGSQFEQLIASLFRRDGYVVRHCGGSGDEGIDLVVEVSDVKDVVQCKRWKSDIGSPVVRDFYGSLMHAMRATDSSLPQHPLAKAPAPLLRGSRFHLLRAERYSPGSREPLRLGNVLNRLRATPEIDSTLTSYSA